MKTRREMREFIALPDRLHADDPNYAPTLLHEARRHFDRERCLFFEHGDGDFYGAWKNGRLVGRITAHVDRLHNHRRGGKTAFFGHFECENDPDAARALFDVATTWAQDRGFDRVRGPVSWGVHGTVGTLVSGFDTPPFVGMAHGRTYYPDLIEEYGFEQTKDLVAWRLDCEEDLEPAAQQLADRVEVTRGLVIREFDAKHFGRDLEIALSLDDAARSLDWGYVSRTAAERESLVRRLRFVVEPRLAFIAELDGEPVAASLAIPNMNELVERNLSRCSPLVTARALWDLRVKRELPGARIGVLALRPDLDGDLRRLGVVLLSRTHRVSRALGVKELEIGWTLADASVVAEDLERTGAKSYKRYRVYEKVLA